MATIVFGASAGNWTDDTKWVGGVKPTAADDAQFVLASGAPTIDAGAVCRSLDTSTFTGIITMGSTGTLAIGDGTAGASNIALKLATGATFAPNAAATITFISTSATLQTVDCGGYTMGNLTFNSASNGVYALTTNTTVAVASTINLTKGTLHTDGATDNSALTHSFGIFNSSGALTRVLTLGTCSITCTAAGTSFTMATVTGLTFSANTASITLSGAGVTMQTGGRTFGGSVNFTGSGTAIIVGAFSIATLTRTGTNVKTDVFQWNTAATVTVALTVSGQSITNRLLLQNASVGTNVLLTIAGATVTATNCDFRDINFSVSTNLSAASGGSGDCGGCTNITFTTAAAQTFSGTVSDSWSTNAWTSRVPLPQDGVTISSAFSASQTVTADMPRLGKAIDWTGATGSPTFALGNAVTSYGSLTFISAMTYSGGAQWTFEGRGASIVTMAGQALVNNTVFAMAAGSMTQADAFAQTSGTTTLTSGTFDSANFSFTCLNFSSSNSQTRVITMGSSTWTITGNGAVWTMTTTTGLTLNANTSTIYLSSVTSSSKTFDGGGKTFNVLQIAGTGTGAVIISGSNTFAKLPQISGGTKTLTLTSGTTQTVTSGTTGFGNGTNLITIAPSATTGTISCASGNVVCNYLNLTNIPSTGGATFYAGANSVDGGGNTGWIFTNLPGAGSGGGGGMVGILGERF